MILSDIIPEKQCWDCLELDEKSAHRALEFILIFILKNVEMPFLSASLWFLNAPAE